jgi:hypothetical protein
MGTVIKKQDITVFQDSWMVLVRNYSRPPFPGELPGLAVHYPNGAGLPEANQEISVGR